MAAPDRLTPAEARRVALAAQGFADRRPAGRIDRRHIRRVLERTALFQLDSVDVVARAHYVPAYSRLGPYPAGLLDEMAWGRRAELFEYWGHEASLLPFAMHPMLRWRMDRARQGRAWGHVVRIAAERPDLVRRVREEVAARGPLRAADLDDGARARRGAWWDRSDAKRALEWLFWTGELAIAGRDGFVRRYDLPERVLPAPVLAAATPAEPEAHRALLRRAARSLGVGTARDLAAYFRIDMPSARARLAELVDEGAIARVSVEGWRDPAYLDSGARLPRGVAAATLVSPFDPLVWERERAERLFGFAYRIEIYTPASARRHGYYVLPFLLGDAFAARVDMKADRRAGTLHVLAAHLEPGRDPAAVAEALAAELARFAGWRGLERIAVARRGDLAGPLRRAAAR